MNVSIYSRKTSGLTGIVSIDLLSKCALNVKFSTPASMGFEFDLSEPATVSLKSSRIIFANTRIEKGKFIAEVRSFASVGFLISGSSSSFAEGFTRA